MASHPTFNKSARSNWNESDKNLVAEQPGLGLSFIGLSFALFAGLAMRAWITPEKVRTQLEKAITTVHQDLHFSFKHAYVSLADGVWPDLSVVIEDVTVASEQSCFLKSVAEVNEIRLPLSWWHLLQGKIFIHEILADEVNLALRTEYKSCSDVANTSLHLRTLTPQPASETATTLFVPTTPLSEPVAPSEFENVSRKNPIDTIRFRSLKVHYLPKAFTSFEVQKLVIKLKKEEPKWIEARGRLNLGGDTLLGDYSSQADMQVDFQEGDKPSVTASFQGVWREGHYDVQAAIDLKSQSFDFRSNVHHLPLSQVIPLFKKYRMMDSDFNGKKAWISGEVKMKGLLSESQQTPIRFEKVKLEGDLGEIDCAQAEIETLNPFRAKPFDLSIKGLDIKELLVFFNRPHPTPTLGDLGIFNGNAHFMNPEDVVLRGDYSGLEFIFANQGVRKVQVLSLVSGELSLEKKLWRISLDRVRPTGGIFEGKVQIIADRDFRDLNLDATIDELSLSPDVQTLMTNGGSLGAMSGHLKTRIFKSEIQSLRGNLRWDQLLVDGVHFNKPKVQLRTQGAETWIDFTSSDFDFAIGNPTIGPLFASVFQEIKSSSEERFLLKNPRGQIRTQNLKQLVWAGFQAQTNRGLIQSKGGWDEKSELFGELKIAGPQKNVWIIGGSRNFPSLRKKEIAE